jgi:hypothetical protein
MNSLTFERSLLLAPLAYAVHHSEEHLIFNFREWRLRYFPDSNSLSTEAIFAVIIGVSMVYLLLNSSVRNKVSAWTALLWLMAVQVHNVIFHAVSTVVFADFSPGLITALLLYIPVNLIIMRAALKEGLVTSQNLWTLFIAGGLLFWAFEFWGPIVLAVGVLTQWAWVLISARAPKHAVT